MNFILTLFLTNHFSLIFLFIFVMRKLFFLILLNLMISKFSAKIETINSSTYENLKDKDDITLVLLFEKWCTHSQKV